MFETSSQGCLGPKNIISKMIMSGQLPCKVRILIFGAKNTIKNDFTVPSSLARVQCDMIATKHIEDNKNSKQHIFVHVWLKPINVTKTIQGDYISMLKPFD